MWKFSELPYERPNVPAFKKQVKAMCKAVESAPNYEAQKAALKMLDKLVHDFSSLGAIAHIRYDINTNDEFYAEEKKFWDKTMPSLIPLEKKRMELMIHLKFRKEFEAEYGTQMFKEAEAQLRLADKRLMLSMVQEAGLKTRYAKLTAGCTTQFRGEKCNFYGLLKYMESDDREIRKAAFMEWARLYESIAPELDEIYDKLIGLRCKMAEKIGMSGYIEMAYLDRGRYDYTPSEVYKFRENIKKYVVPAVAKLYEQQRERIGVDKLRYYDEKYAYPDGNPTPIGTRDELVEKAAEMYRELSPETGEFFDFMKAHELFDLETRDGKRMGGYCTTIASKLSPFIFSNFNGTSADVDVLTHEAGHAFQAYLAMRSIPWSEQMHAPMEICEVHSMSMEHFTYPWMDKFFGDKADKYRSAHLQDALKTIPYLVAVDDFQHRVFEKPGMTRDERYACWKEIEGEYLPWRDYDGNEFLEKGGFWMQKQHIFLYPFYYIDYALAQTCAFGFYIKMCEDGKAAWEDYLRLCKAGGCLGYFELLELANLPNPFAEGTVQNMVDAVMKKIEEQAR
ncbi:MAG: M3 family oligoendopeptidase [Clostridia bacterium]|nr:M3 family oligoendopeptidase [Clostridia bacterium]